MKHIYPAMALVLAFGTLSVSCDKIKPPQPEIKPEAPAPVSSTAQQEQSTFTQGAQKELDELRNTIARLKARAQAAGAESKEKLLEEARKLEESLSATQQQLEKLKLATVETWHQVKETVETSMDKLKDAVKSATQGSS
jgi:hypothetical protein